MRCKISAWGCVYHACMSDDCQKHEVLKTQLLEDWGPGKCEIQSDGTADPELEDFKY